MTVVSDVELRNNPTQILLELKPEKKQQKEHHVSVVPELQAGSQS